MLGNVNWCCISTTKRNYYCAMQYTIASNALIKRTLERTDIKSSVTLLSFRILTTISNFRNWTIMANFGNNLTLSLTSGTQEQFMTSATQQYLISVTEQQHLPSGTVTVISGFRNNNHLRNIWPISPTDIYVYVHLKYNSSVSIANIQHDHQLSVKQVQLGSNKCFKMSIKVECCNKDAVSLLLSLSRKEFKFIPHFY